MRKIAIKLWCFFRISSSYVFHPYNNIDVGKVQVYPFPHVPTLNSKLWLLLVPCCISSRPTLLRISSARVGFIKNFIYLCGVYLHTMDNVKNWSLFVFATIILHSSKPYTLVPPPMKKQTSN